MPTPSLRGRPNKLQAAFFLSLVFSFTATAAPTNSGVCDTRSPAPGADVVLIIDRSGSMGNGINTLGVPPPGELTRLAAVQQASSALVERLAAVDRAGLVSYSTQTTFDLALTFDRLAATTAIDALVTDDDTYAEPAIRLATQELVTRGRTGVRKVIVHLSDGFSFGNPVAAATAAKAAGIEFYAVAIRDPRPLQSSGVELLRQQASDAAHFYLIDDAADLFDAFDDIGSKVTTGQLDLLARAYGVRGTGTLLSAVNAVTPLVNDIRYRYDESRDPATVQQGGSRDSIAIPVNLGNGAVSLSAKIVSDSATGAVNASNRTANADASSRITALNLRVAGLSILTADVIESRAQARVAANAFTRQGSVLTATLRVLGLPITVQIQPNSTIWVPLVGRLILNEQPLPASSSRSISQAVNFAHLYVTIQALAGDLVLAHSFAGASCEEGLPPFPLTE